MRFITRHIPSPSMAVALLALGVALGGTSYAAIKLPKNSVGSKQIKANAVTGVKVRDASLFANDFAPGQLPRGAVGPAGPRGAQGPKGDAATLGAPEAWKPLPFSIGWGNYGGGHVLAAYRKDQLGKVHLRGLVAKLGAPTPVLFDAIGVLPTGYRPPGSTHFAVAMGRPDLAGTAFVQSNGTVTWLSGPNTNPDDYTDLTGISFWPGP